ncbi:nucleolin [Clonorchis sinensis]|uniref:Nucleolin n=2 Tax=Clonorchis sinensis TaxID=79923 RepID=A0A8T1M9K5_CLOSI|nr:nucleolin [Clonorchis sinensis]GAA27834.2 nucleolin [Clonorchis sinensis]
MVVSGNETVSVLEMRGALRDESDDQPLISKGKKRPASEESPQLDTESNTASTKTQRKRIKRKQKLAEKLDFKAKRPKRDDQEPPVSAKIILPKTKGYVSLLDTEEKKLSAAKARLAEMYTNVLKIQPIPRPCPPGLLRDLCPLAVSVRIPTKNGAGYAFLQFRNQVEMEAAQKLLTTKSLGTKPLQVTVASPVCRSNAEDWHGPEARTMSDFDWNTLFVTRLPRATTRLDLGQVFRKARGIRLSLFDDGSCKGTCTLRYKSPSDALQAFETRHGTFIRGSPIYVNFALNSKKPKPSPPVMPMETEDLVSPQERSDTTKSIKKAVDRTPMKSHSDEFVIDKKPASAPSQTVVAYKSDKKTRKGATNRPQGADPKILAKHQLKRKGAVASKCSVPSPLELLLRPPASKPKSAKKSKKLTKRGKPSKHR